MADIEYFLDRNRAWASGQVEKDPSGFQALAEGQQPEMLWIGCSDSRVSPNQMMDLSLGEVFVHRNIANQVVISDPNCMSVVQYAVEVLEVAHIVVCGHYGCGGVIASFDPPGQDTIQQWLDHIRRVGRRYQDELADLDAEARIRRLCEVNVVEQVRNLAATDILQAAWQEGGGPTLHGLIYGLHDGRLRRLCHQTGSGDLILDPPTSPGL